MTSLSISGAVTSSTWPTCSSTISRWASRGQTSKPRSSSAPPMSPASPPAWRRRCGRGYAARILLSQDASAYFDWYEPEVIKAYVPNWSYFHIVDDIIPALLEAGVTQPQIDTMTRDNPRRIFENVGQD